MPFVVANGVRTFYRAVGDGPPLLLIAGNGMDHTAFDEQLPSFGRHFRCIVYDLRGIGQSDVPSGGYTTPEMARDALALLDCLEIERAHVAGYSLGGAIGQEMAASAPERVQSLSLYSSFDRPDPYLRLRYDLLVKILLEASPEMWATFTAFSAFGIDYINANEATQLSLNTREQLTDQTDQSLAWLQSHNLGRHDRSGRRIDLNRNCRRRGIDVQQSEACEIAGALRDMREDQMPLRFARDRRSCP